MTFDLTTHVGDVVLASPVLTAAGTSGYGDELAEYGDLRKLGAVVTKSLATFDWAGNAPPRVSSSGSRTARRPASHPVSEPTSQAASPSASHPASPSASHSASHPTSHPARRAVTGEAING